VSVPREVVVYFGNAICEGIKISKWVIKCYTPRGCLPGKYPIKIVIIILKKKTF
jgi:hypothetical protein